jgi:hypothetical protein
MIVRDVGSWRSGVLDRPLEETESRLPRSPGTLLFKYLLVATTLACSACGEKENPIIEDPFEDLSFEEQAKAAAHEFLAIAKANATKSCKRPVLRGTPLPGKAADDIIAAVEPAGENDSCLLSLTEEKDLRLRNFYFGYGEFSQDGFPPRKLGTVRPFDNDSKTREPFDHLLTACAPALVRAGKAVAHTDACSPYLPGVRKIKNEDGYSMHVRFTMLVAVSMIERARAGERKIVLEMILDQIRFEQDLHRGGTSLINAMIATAGTGRLVPVLEWILNRPDPLGSPLLAQIDREFAALVASEPHPSEFLDGDTVDTAVFSALPMLLGPRWSPPGKVIGKPDEAIAFGPINARLMLVTEHRNRLAYLIACRPENTPAACFFNMDEMSEKAADTYNTDRKSRSRWVEWIRDPARVRPNGETPSFVSFLSLVAFKNYVLKHGQTRFYLGALRLLARYRALAEKTGSCPGIEAFDRPDFADARIDPYSGKPLRVEVVGDGRFLVSSPEKLELGPYPNDAINIRVKCPFADAAKPTVDGGV